MGVLCCYKEREKGVCVVLLQGEREKRVGVLCCYKEREKGVCVVLLLGEREKGVCCGGRISLITLSV